VSVVVSHEPHRKGLSLSVTRLSRLSRLPASFNRLQRIQPTLDSLPKLGEPLLHLGLRRACVLGDGGNAGDHVLVQDVHVPVQVINTAFQAAQPLLDSIETLFGHAFTRRGTTTIHRPRG
jgi:hypothetical protein